MSLAKIILPTMAVAAGTIGSGAAVVSADTTTATNTSSTANTSQVPPKDANDPSVKDGGKITDDATVVAAITQSVQAKYDGATIDRVAQLPDGSYLAFSVQSGGTKTIVSLDNSYAVTTTKDVPAGAPARANALAQS